MLTSDVRRVSDCKDGIDKDIHFDVVYIYIYMHSTDGVVDHVRRFRRSQDLALGTSLPNIKCRVLSLVESIITASTFHIALI